MATSAHVWDAFCAGPQHNVKYLDQQNQQCEPVRFHQGNNDVHRRSLSSERRCRSGVALGSRYWFHGAEASVVAKGLATLA